MNKIFASFSFVALIYANSAIAENQCDKLTTGGTCSTQSVDFCKFGIMVINNVCSLPDFEDKILRIDVDIIDERTVAILVTTNLRVVGFARYYTEPLPRTEEETINDALFMTLLIREAFQIMSPIPVFPGYIV